MHVRLCCILFVGIIVLFTAGCPFMGLEYEDDLVGDYAVWATDTMEQAAVVRKDKGTSGAVGVVGKMVFAYGWSDDFIIAKQHPPYPNEYFKIDTSTTHWHIVEVKTGKVHGPLTEDEFRQRRAELKVPSSLGFSKTI